MRPTQSQYALLTLLAVTSSMPISAAEVDPACRGMVKLAQSTGFPNVDERLAIGKAKVDYMRSCAGLDAHIEDSFGMCAVSYDEGTRTATAKCHPYAFQSSSELPDGMSIGPFGCIGELQPAYQQLMGSTTNDPDLERLHAIEFAKDDYIERCEKGNLRDVTGFNEDNFRTRYDPKSKTAVAVCLPNNHCGTPRGK